MKSLANSRSLINPAFIKYLPYILKDFEPHPSYWICATCWLVKERANHGYVEEKLKVSLEGKLQDLEQRCESLEHARSFFGEEMYRKFLDIERMRGEAFVIDQGNWNYSVSLIKFLRSFILTPMLCNKGKTVLFKFR